MFWLSLLSIPVFGVLCIVFIAASHPKTEVSKVTLAVNFVQIFLGIGAFAFAMRGSHLIIEEDFGRPPEGEIFFLTVPALCFVALGVLCWSFGYHACLRNGRA